MNNRTNIKNKGIEEIYQNKGNIGYNDISNFTTNLTFSLIFAVLMAISANSFIYLPFTPIPITTQVLTVLLSALFLGSRWASISQIIYILMGLMGLPVFSGFKNGITALPGPTGGYIIGFIAAAFVTGYIYENSPKKNTSSIIKLFFCLISCIAGVLLIHLFGFIHLFGYFYSISGTNLVLDTLIKTWKLGTQPFLAIDFLKIISATIIVNLNKIKK